MCESSTDSTSLPAGAGQPNQEIGDGIGDPPTRTFDDHPVAIRPEDGPRCARCGATAPAGADACPACRSFVRGNRAARTHGLYGRPPADLRMTADELVAGIVSDLGGEAELTALERNYIRRIGDLEIMLRLLASDIARAGLHTPGGRVRQSFDKFVAGAALFDRLAVRLGLKRRQRDIGTLDAVRRAVERANR